MILPIILIVALTPLIIFLVWWLIFETEGVYLGKRMVVWLYDVYASRYDDIKEFDVTADYMLLSEPILMRIRPYDNPMVLDAATGTGRIPLILAQNAHFDGHVIGLDHSRKMLDQAQTKIDALYLQDFITLVKENAQEMPFLDNSFDVVTCVEALEFMPSPEETLKELIRVLRPGGLLLTTIRDNMRWMPNRTWSEATMREKLQENGMHTIQVEIWQEDYSKVWAVKSGESEFIGARPIEEILR